MSDTLGAVVHLTFLSPLFYLFHGSVYSGVTYTKMLTYLSQRIVPAPVCLSDAFVADFDRVGALVSINKW